MVMDDIEIFTKNKKEQEILIQITGIEHKDIGMELFRLKNVPR